MLSIELQLEPIDRSNWRDALQVSTTPEQLEFVADYQPVALVILAKSYVRSNDFDWYPFAIKTRAAIVGVVAIARRERRCEIFHLVIDRRSQGRGVGKAAVGTITEYIRKTWPQCKTVSLTVHPGNKIAEHVYLSNGFKASGEVRDTEAVLELVL